MIMVMLVIAFCSVVNWLDSSQAPKEVAPFGAYFLSEIATPAWYVAQNDVCETLFHLTVRSYLWYAGG